MCRKNINNQLEQDNVLRKKSYVFKFLRRSVERPTWSEILIVDLIPTKKIPSGKVAAQLFIYASYRPNFLKSNISSMSGDFIETDLGGRLFAITFSTSVL